MTTRQRRSIVPAAVALLVAFACRPAADPPAERPQNLLLITIDTLRADRLGCYGDAAAETPQLDRLAAGGARFERCYTSVPLTLPAHSVLFTGRYPFHTGVRVNSVHYLPPREVTLAERFREAGYTTFAAVAAYVLSSTFGLDQGFALYDDSLGAKGLFDHFGSQIPAERVYGKLSAWLAGGVPTPFFAWLHFYDPHMPYDPPADVAARFPEDPYRGEIAAVDRTVGRVLDALDARGLLARTLVVVTSDHGEAFLEHGEEGHGLLAYDETLRVPLLVAGPGVARRTVGERVGLVDLAPTLLDLFGLASPGALDGESLAPLLADGAEGEDHTVYFETLAGQELKNWAPLTGIVAGRYKLISLPEPELYDLAADPGEKRNLYADQRRQAHALEEQLGATLAAGAGGGAEPRREPTAEDTARLRALGYLDRSAASATPHLDPKRGIAIDMQLRYVRTLVSEGKVDEAERLLERVVAANRDVEMPDFFELRHEIHAARGESAAAVAALEEAVARFPDRQGLQVRLATALLAVGRLDEAAERCRAIVAANPHLTQALQMLARIAARRGDLEGAAGYLRRALVLEPRNVPAETELADLLARSGKVTESAEIYAGLVDRGALEGDAEHLYKAAMVYSQVGRLAEAEALFRRGLELAPAAVHQMGLAMLLLQSGALEEAARTLDQALANERDPLSAEQRRLALQLRQQLATGAGPGGR